MKLQNLLFLFIAAFLLQFCLTKDQKSAKYPIKIEKRIIFPAIKSAKLFNQLRPEVQKFKIKPNRNYYINGKNGTYIFIPANSFINAKGEIIKENVEIELIEALTIADFINSNLQTLSNGKVLQSAGMIFIDAKSKGESLALAEGKQLQIEMSNISSSDIKIFSGKYDTLGNINWNQSGETEKRLISLPLKLFDFKFWKSYDIKLYHPYDNRGYTYFYTYDSEIIDSLTFYHPRFENTFIATREFEERFEAIWSAENAITDYAFDISKAKKGKIILDSTIINFYLHNLNKPLWYCDSLAYNYVKKQEGSRKTRPSFLRTERNYFDCYDNCSEIFEEFYKQRLTTVINLNFSAIDFESPNARGKLIEKGFENSEIDEILGAYARQKKIILARKNEKEARLLSTNSFSTSQLGWINCDRFYNDPSAKEANILANLSNAKDFEFASVSLVFKRGRIVLGGNLTKNKHYTFTGESQPYTKLPIGERAMIIALSYKDDKPYLATQEIKISEKATYNLELKASSKKEIEEILIN